MRILSLVFLSPLLLLAQPALDSKITQAIDDALKAAGAPSVSVAVINHDQVIFAGAFGKANIEADRAADVHTRYAVGSISKEFTAAAILLAQEQHKLSLDDKVSKYFPNLTRANEITIRQLLSHTSGYEDYAPQDYLIPEWTRPTTPQAILDRFAKKPLNFDPGTRWQYSNIITFWRARFSRKRPARSWSHFSARRSSSRWAFTRRAIAARPVRRMRAPIRALRWARRGPWGAKRAVGTSPRANFA